MRWLAECQCWFNTEAGFSAAESPLAARSRPRGATSPSSARQRRVDGGLTGGKGLVGTFDTVPFHVRPRVTQNLMHHH